MGEPPLLRRRDCHPRIKYGVAMTKWVRIRPMTTVYTIGFTRRTAEDFFETLRRAGVKRLLDVRLRNTSQMAIFARRQDLPYFLRELNGMDYEHQPLLSPTPELLDDWRSKRITWQQYERVYADIMARRRPELTIAPADFSVPTVLLCAEPTAEQCHRRLALEHLATAWNHPLDIVHL